MLSVDRRDPLNLQDLKTVGDDSSKMPPVWRN